MILEASSKISKPFGCDWDPAQGGIGRVVANRL